MLPSAFCISLGDIHNSAQVEWAVKSLRDAPPIELTEHLHAEHAPEQHSAIVSGWHKRRRSASLVAQQQEQEAEEERMMREAAGRAEVLRKRREAKSPPKANVASTAAREKDELRSIFRLADVDASGFLDFDELLALGRAVNAKFTPDQCLALLKILDTNHDNKVSEEEFLGLVQDYLKFPKGARETGMLAMKVVAEHVAKKAQGSPDKHAEIVDDWHKRRRSASLVAQQQEQEAEEERMMREAVERAEALRIRREAKRDASPLLVPKRDASAQMNGLTSSALFAVPPLPEPEPAPLLTVPPLPARPSHDLPKYTADVAAARQDPAETSISFSGRCLLSTTLHFTMSLPSQIGSGWQGCKRMASATPVARASSIQAGAVADAAHTMAHTHRRSRTRLLETA